MEIVFVVDASNAAIRRGTFKINTDIVCQFANIGCVLSTPEPDVPPPMPSSDEHIVLAAILAGVQNLQRNYVTRDQMKQLVDLQRQEFLTLVRAETEPLHCAVNQLHSNARTIVHGTFQVSERMNTLENRVAQFQNAVSFENKK